MTTNQTIDGVPREAVSALEKARDVLRAIIRDKAAGVHYASAQAACHQISATLDDLRALLEAPCPFPGYPPVPEDRKLPAAQPQGEPVAWLIQCQHSGLVEQSEPNDKSDRPDEWSDSFPVFRRPAAPIAVPRLEMAHVVRAHMEITGCPVLTSNQCHALAMKLNACLDEVTRLNAKSQ